MNIVSFNQIIELNNLLQNKDLQFKVHIKDACGAQSFYIEQLGDSNFIEINDKLLYNTIDEYFKNDKMTVVYYDDKYRFKIQQYANHN